jgi:hypothetical protein
MHHVLYCVLTSSSICIMACCWLWLHAQLCGASCVYVCIGRIVGTNTIAIAIIFLFPISAVACYGPILLLPSSS